MTSSKRKFMFQAEMAHRLGISPDTAKVWRKAGRGPKWYMSSSERGHGRPIYYRDSVEELHAAFVVLERHGLRHANCASLPPDDPEAGSSSEGAV